MESLRFTFFGDFYDFFDIEITLGRNRLAYRIGLLSQPDMQSLPVRIRINGHRRHTQFTAGPDDPDSNLAPVGDQYLLEHPGHLFTLRSSVCTSEL